MRKRNKYTNLPFNPVLKERARQLRKAGNLAEVLMWQQFHKKSFKGYDFDRQKIIGNYIVDFFCLDCGVVIEVDGSIHDTQTDYDSERDFFLKGLGLVVIRIQAKDVLHKLNDVMIMLNNHPALGGSLSEGSDHPGASRHPSLEGN